MVLDCKGTVFFSGVGKSGFISQKISMTLVSTVGCTKFIQVECRSPVA
jgi:D-arabinose 5-phosphate isomerase GutQ